MSYRLVECQHVRVIKPLAKASCAQDNAANMRQRRNVVQFLDGLVQLLEIATVFSSTTIKAVKITPTHLRDDTERKEPAL